MVPLPLTQYLIYSDLSTQEPDPTLLIAASCCLACSQRCRPSHCAAPGTDAGASLEARVTISVVRSLLTKITLSDVSVLAS
jgi:hypothetical protein